MQDKEFNAMRATIIQAIDWAAMTGGFSDLDASAKTRILDAKGALASYELPKAPQKKDKK